MVTLPLLLILAGTPAGSAATPADSGDLAQNLEPDAVEAPPGPAADRALWRELRDVTAFSTIQLARVAQISFRMRYGRYFEELDSRAKAPDDIEAQALLSRLRAVVARARERIPEQPGIYQCRRVLLGLEVHLKGLPDPKAEAGLPEARAKARECADRMKLVLAAVTDSAQSLDKATTDADAYLKRQTPSMGGDGRVPSARETLDAINAGATR